MMAMMMESLNNLIEALRDELGNYGEMLLLLDRQWEYLKNRAAQDVSQSISQVRIQGETLEASRERREKCFRAVVSDLGRNEILSCHDLIPLMPPDYRPLLKALLEENNELLSLVRRRARQNHSLLKRSMDLMQQVVNSLCPEENEPALQT
jgi:hypothetical protein